MVDDAVGGSDPTKRLKRELAVKDRLIADVEDTIRSLKLESASKDLVNSNL